MPAAARRDRRHARGVGRPGRRPGPTIYRNPVSRAVGDTYADPDVVRGKDGWWYAYATSDPLRTGETTRHYIPMSRSRDLVHWTYAGDAFSPAKLPSWADTTTHDHTASLWAPDVHYVTASGGCTTSSPRRAVTPTTDAEVNDNAIGMATAPTPLGPWTDSGAPVVGPRRVVGEQLPLDLRPRRGARHRRQRAHLLRLVLRRDLRADARPQRQARRRRREADRHRQQVRGHLHQAQGRRTGTCSPRRPTAAPARPPGTASRSGARGR